MLTNRPATNTASSWPYNGVALFPRKRGLADAPNLQALSKFNEDTYFALQEQTIAEHRAVKETLMAWSRQSEVRFASVHIFRLSVLFLPHVPHVGGGTRMLHYIRSRATLIKYRQ